MENHFTKEQLQTLQNLPLEAKILRTQSKIIEWYQHYNGQVVVSFSGGKDSTVLLHLVRQLYPTVPAVFANTGLEYPEIVRFAHSFQNVDVVTPKMRFIEVIGKYGYPLISKEIAQDIYGGRNYHALRTRSKFSEQSDYCQRYGTRFCLAKWLPLLHLPIGITHLCCTKTKKEPAKRYIHSKGYAQFVGTLAEESYLRRNAWIKHGCNAFESKNPTSQPLSFWTEQDILTYIVQNNIEIASVYGEIVAKDADGNVYPAKEMLAPCGKLKCSKCQRTGCIFCGFGFHNEKGETRFQQLAKTHPKQYEYALGGGQWVDNPAYDATAPKYDGDWENWNPKKIWVPSKQGIGLRAVFDMVNEIYGKNFYRYE